MRLIAKLIGLVGLVVVVVQFVRPKLTNPPVTAEIQAPPEVKAVLKKSCYNCHSNETALPWFDRVVPAYWVVARDVKTARAHLNFSEIGKLPPTAQRAVLFEAVTQIQLGAMPLPSYLRIHPDAKLSREDLAVLKAYLDPFAKPPVVDAALTASGESQYKAWTESGEAVRVVSPEPNGLEFLPDYKNWKEISMTDRRDNHTMRVIAGNEVAIKAIETKQVYPWPDGTAFAKIAWDEVPDEMGVLHADQFKQVELMVKDSKKYAATGGWGYGRWRGMELKPYGKDANFTSECVSCHLPVKDNDYVYTMPLERKGR